MSLAQGHTLGATVTKHDSNCLICNQAILGLGEDFGQVSLSNVNSLCQILSFPELGGLELGSSKALIAFCNDCSGRVEMFQSLLVQLNEIMGQMEGIRQELSQQLLESAKNTNGYAYIINTRNLFAAQLQGVEPESPQVLSSMPNPCEDNGSVYASDTLVKAEDNMDSSFIAVPPELFSSTNFQMDHEDLGQESFSDGNGNATYYLQQQSSTSACSTPAEETFRLITQEYVHPEEPQPSSDTEDCVFVLDDEDESSLSSTPSNAEIGEVKCALHACTLRFETELEMLCHFECHYPQMFGCTLCPKVCNTPFYLKQHVIRVHNLHGPETLEHRLVSSPFKCPHRGCAHGFVDQEKLKRHFKNKHELKYIPTRVKGCGKIKLKPVKNIVPPPPWKKKHQCTFEGCTEIFEKRHLMYKHKAKVHKPQNQNGSGSSESKSKDVSNNREEPEVIDVPD